MTYEVALVGLAPQEVAVVHGKETVEGIAGFLGHAFEQVMQVVAAEGGAIVGPPFASYRDVGGAFEIEAGFPVAGQLHAQGDVEIYDRHSGNAAQTMHVGPYGEVAAAYGAVETWLAGNGWKPVGAPWEEYLDEPTVAEPRTLVTFPCAHA